MILPFLLVSLAQAPGAQWAAAAPDGRIALERSGHLYVMRQGTAPVRITSDASLNRQPAWTADGRALIYVSDRGGGTHLWRIEIDGLNPARSAEQLTRGAESDTEPALTADGRVVFVRGTGAAADLWLRALDGTEKKLTTESGAERSPAVSKQGVVAYIALRDGRRQLRTIRLDGTADRLVLSEPAPEYPSWSPAGDRIAFVSSGNRRAVLLTNGEGTYTNTVGLRRGRPAWLDEQTLIVSEIPNDGAGYNGDPDRISDREAERDATFDGAVWSLAVPAPPDAQRTQLTFQPVGPDCRRPGRRIRTCLATRQRHRTTAPRTAVMRAAAGRVCAASCCPACRPLHHKASSTR